MASSILFKLILKNLGAKLPNSQPEMEIYQAFSGEMKSEIVKAFYLCTPIQNMILPIVAYGDPVLRQECEEISQEYPNLDQLISNMFDTMYQASGVGLAAPQIGLPIRLFIVDASPFAEGENPDQSCADFKRVFINPIIFEESGNEWGFEEGCLSIPKIREEVKRKPDLKIEYYTPEWELVEEELSGFPARIVQHEYDHIEGILFTDHISAIRRTLISTKLSDISKGNVDVDYRMKFPKSKRR